MEAVTSKTILLVEDEAIIALAEKKALERYGYSVVVAHSGEKAITCIKEHPGIDLILMDIDLGSGMDGTEAAAVILESNNLPIVFLSSHAEPEIVEKTEKITSYGYVVKNSSITVLDASIKMAFKLFKARETLMESEARFQDLFENMNDAFALHEIIYAVDSSPVDYRFIEVNGLFAQRVGLSRDEVIGRTALQLFPTTEKSWIEAFGRVASTGVPELFTNYSSELDRYYETHLYCPRKGYCAGLFSDVTEAKRMEQENQALADVIRRSQDFIGVADPETEAFFVNPAGQAMVGLEGDAEVKRTKVRDYFFEEDLALLEHSILPTVKSEGRWAGEFRFRHFKTGKPIHVYYDLFLSGNSREGTATNLTTISRDISGQKLAEARLQKSEEKYRFLFNFSNDAIFVHAIDADGLPGNNIEVNEQACQLLQYSREELLTMSIRDFSEDGQTSAMRAIAQKLMGKKHLVFQTKDIRRDGVAIPVEVSAYVYEEAGQHYVVSSVRDISQRENDWNRNPLYKL